MQVADRNRRIPFEQPYSNRYIAGVKHPQYSDRSQLLIILTSYCYED